MALFVLLVMVMARGAAGQQQAWEYAPYRIRVWLATDHSPRLGNNIAAQVEQALRQQGRVLGGATWQLTLEEAPGQLRIPILHSLESMGFEQIEPLSESLFDQDKLWIVGLTASDKDFRVVARELDLKSRVWSPLVQRRVVQRQLLAQHVFQTAAATFAPVARIEDVQGLTAKLRLRAAGLVIDSFCPSAVEPGDVMTTVIRINDRDGQPRPNGIREVEWTLLQVNKVDGPHLECAVHSINRGYLGGRTSSRIQRFALGLRTIGDSTTVKIFNKAEPPEPLAGYEIYSKDPQTDESHLVGHTDWRGAIEISRSENPLQVLYVRSGGMLLARLPLVPGQSLVATVSLADDENRLRAEALAKSVQSALIDLVAQRELLAARIRKRIEEKKLDEAQELVDSYRKLPTLADLRGQLDRARQEVATDNPRMQARIDKLFADVQSQLVKFVNPNQVDLLASELSKARTQ